MTRGKHGAQADRRRAEETNAEIRRWREEAAKWKRLAHQYVEEAKRSTRLEASVRRLKGELGVPEYEHDRELAELEAKWAERWDEAMAATTTIISCLMGATTADTSYLSSAFLSAMRTLPGDVTRAATADVWTREEYRTFLTADAVDKTHKHALSGVTAAAMGRGYGSNPNGGIPREAMDDPEFRAAAQRAGDLKSGQGHPRHREDYG